MTTSRASLWFRLPGGSWHRCEPRGHRFGVVPVGSGAWRQVPEAEGRWVLRRVDAETWLVDAVTLRGRRRLWLAPGAWGHAGELEVSWSEEPPRRSRVHVLRAALLAIALGVVGAAVWFGTGHDPAPFRSPAGSVAKTTIRSPAPPWPSASTGTTTVRAVRPQHGAATRTRPGDEHADARSTPTEVAATSGERRHERSPGGGIREIVIAIRRERWARTRLLAARCVGCPPSWRTAIGAAASADEDLPSWLAAALAWRRAASARPGAVPDALATVLRRTLGHHLEPLIQERRWRRLRRVVAVLDGRGLLDLLAPRLRRELEEVARRIYEDGYALAATAPLHARARYEAARALVPWDAALAATIDRRLRELVETKEVP